jgi:hypothetical protein
VAEYAVWQSDANTDSDCDSYTKAHAHTEACTHAEAPPNSGTAAVASK